MYLNDNLQICLLAVHNRYPHHTIDLDNEIITMRNIEAEGWTAQELVAFFSEYAPRLLQAPAHLHINGSRCELYLPLQSNEKPAFSIHCRGKVPAPHSRGGKSVTFSF